jgi:DNA processing protein
LPSEKCQAERKELTDIFTKMSWQKWIMTDKILIKDNNDMMNEDSTVKTDLDSIKAWLKLISTKDIGNAKAIRLVKLLGKPESFVENSSKLTDVDFISDSAKRELLQDSLLFEWEPVKELIERYNIGFLSYFDDLYPPLLKHIFDPPPFLFYRGDIGKDYWRRVIAIVGTRKPSNYGKLMTKKIGTQLAEMGFTIVSGLAYGIDTLAHFSALEVNGKTIAVMGTGCDQIYPARNKELAKQIIEKGLLLSEYIPGSKAEKWNFPTRNRIISGISLGCLVIEGSEKSGAMLTAKFALDQNRDVFALPGDINREEAKGPNSLIKSGAKIVTSVQDILDEYDLTLEQSEISFPQLSPEEESIYQIIVKNKPEAAFDTILIEAEMSISKLSTVLLNLELKSVIKKIPGNKIVPLY